MKIGIDARMYSQSGIGRYLKNLIAHLQKIDKKNDYFIFLRKEEFEQLKFSSNFTKVLADYSWYGLEEQLKFPRVLNKYNLDLVHFPHFNVPVLYRGQFVVTIHDLIHQKFNMKRATTRNPLTFKIKQLSYHVVFGNAVRRSKKIFTPSTYVQDLLNNKWKVNKEKIIVTLEAVDQEVIEKAKKISKKESLEMLNNLSITPPYLFYLGNAHPHKNIEKLIDVFLKLQDKYPKLNLVLSGNDHYFWRRLQSELIVKGADEHIRFTGYVTDDQAVALYKNAVCFVMPSLDEGFGIPLLEAMAADCPVVSSNAGSLAQVGGDACLYFDPISTEDMFNKIEQLLKSERLRQDLIKKGQKRVKEFSWEKLAKQTLEVYQTSI